MHDRGAHLRRLSLTGGIFGRQPSPMHTLARTSWHRATGGLQLPDGPKYGLREVAGWHQNFDAMVRGRGENREEEG